MLALQNIEIIKACADIFTSALVPLSVYLAYLQMKKTLEWNKKKTAEEALTQIVSGDVLKCYESVFDEFGWSLLTDGRGYGEISKNMPAEQVARLDKLLLTILRQLETLAIKIEHDVYDESICFDYLFSIVMNTHKRCVPYIEKTRMAREEPRLFEHVEKYANKWAIDIAKGRKH